MTNHVLYSRALVILSSIILVPFVARGSGGCTENVCKKVTPCSCPTQTGPWIQYSCTGVSHLPQPPHSSGCCNTLRQQVVCNGVVKQAYKAVNGATNSTCDSYDPGGPPCQCNVD